jgi:hypothetical protein
MNRSQLLSILGEYEELLKDFGPAARADTFQLLKVDPNRTELLRAKLWEQATAYRHVLWMLGEMRKMLEPFAEVPPEKFYAAQAAQEKVARWLGFVQGVLWSYGVCSIDEMRNHNRPK